MFFVTKVRKVNSARCPFHDGHKKTYTIDCTQSTRTKNGPRREFLCSLRGRRDCCLADVRTRKLLLEAGKRKLDQIGGGKTDVQALKELMARLEGGGRHA